MDDTIERRWGRKIRKPTAPLPAHPINHAAHQRKSRLLTVTNTSEHTSQHKTETCAVEAHSGSGEVEQADTVYGSFRHGEVPAPEPIPVMMKGETLGPRDRSRVLQLGSSAGCRAIPHFSSRRALCRPHWKSFRHCSDRNDFRIPQRLSFQPIALATITPPQADTAVSVSPHAMSAATIEGC